MDLIALRVRRSPRKKNIVVRKRIKQEKDSANRRFESGEGFFFLPRAGRLKNKHMWGALFHSQSRLFVLHSRAVGHHHGHEILINNAGSVLTSDTVRRATRNPGLCQKDRTGKKSNLLNGNDKSSGIVSHNIFMPYD